MKSRRLASLLAILPVTSTVLLRAAENPAAPAEPKTHVLFMGTDIAIEQGKEFHRVKEVSGSTFVITVKGRPEFIPTTRRALNLKVEQSLKLTRSTAVLENLKGERTYSPGNDPKMAAIQAQSRMTMLASSQQEIAQRNLMNAVASAGVRDAQIAQGGPAGAAAAAAPGPDTAGAARALESATLTMGSDFTSGAYHAGRGEAGSAEGNFDAMEVSFLASSPEPLRNPYVIVITRYRERDAAPGAIRNWIYAQALKPIEAKPQKVTVRQAGFPQGFIVEEFQVHLYDRGQEIATNVSPKRVDLTTDEAFQYLVIEHVAAHKNATLGPVPVMGALPADYRSRLAAGQGQQVYHVKVAKDGRVTDVYRDEACTQPVDDPYFEAAVKAVRFKPALEKGRPVGGRATIDLTKLSF